MKKNVCRATCIMVLVLSVTLFAGLVHAQPSGVLYQVATINSLMQGVYDGETTVKELKQHGDFGIGAPHRLDVELVALDGKFYQVKSTGQVLLMKDSMKIPFATVTYFKPQQPVAIPALDSFSQVEAFFNQILEEKNYFYAIRIDGVFGYVKTRSIPAQDKPYKPLGETVKEQQIFELRNVRGTIVGFWAPQYVNGINVPGYHLHFLTQDRQQGGHVLELAVLSGTYQVNRITDFHMSLPVSGDFAGVNLAKDVSAELKKVEK